MLSKKLVRRDDSNKVVWKDTKKGIIFNQIFLCSSRSGEGGPPSNEHYLEFVGFVQSELFCKRR